MEFYDVLERRRSYRAYDPNRQVPDEAIAKITRAVAQAPTACNRQPVRLLVVRNAELRKKICAVCSHFAWLETAPAILVALGNETEAWTRREGDSIINVDVAIVMEHALLAATAEKLGTCWVCAFDRAAMDAALNTASPWKVVAISPLGYALPGSTRTITHKNDNELIQVID